MMRDLRVMIFLKNVGRGIQYCQISIRYWIVQASKRRVKRMNNKSWICQICNKYFYGWNDNKETFQFYFYQPISTMLNIYSCGYSFPYQHLDINKDIGTEYFLLKLRHRYSLVQTRSGSFFKYNIDQGKVLQVIS